MAKARQEDKILKYVKFQKSV